MSHLAKCRKVYSNGTLVPSNIDEILTPKISQQRQRTPKITSEKSPKQNFNSESAQSRQVYPSSTLAKIDATKKALFQSPEIDRPSTSCSIHKTSLPSFKGNNSSKTSHYKRMPAVPKASSLQNGELSAHHKSKLRWAVFEALRRKNIGFSHPNFKTYAAILARVTTKFFTSNVPHPEKDTSAQMLRIALQHIYSVIVSVEEIMVHEAQKQISNKIVKPSPPPRKLDIMMVD